ncbi:cytochrome P450 [Catenaria anguillulae PL171]|uniref:Cytochrome P450 n=1 Tax=Catenaria anguillulae PL171 TaxID=765915 RepID=A0A1Y2I3M7_9FUNG|nr:cytochrome P450 [Catenaria anguillulae PL171]
MIHSLTRHLVASGGYRRQAPLLLSNAARRPQSTATAPTAPAAPASENVTTATSSPLPFTSIPSLPIYPIVGSIPSFRAHDPSKNKNQYHRAQQAIHANYGPLVRLQLPGQTGPSLWIADPHMIAESFQSETKYPTRPAINTWIHYRQQRNQPLGIVVSNGPEWRRARMAAQGLIFNPQRAQKAFTKCVNPPTRLGMDKIEQLLRAQGDSAVQGNTTVNIEDVVMRWSIEAISSILLGRSLGMLSDPPNPLAQRIIRAFVDLVRTLGPVVQTPEWAWKLRLTKSSRLHFRALEDIHHICDELTRDVLKDLAQLPKEELEGTFLGHILARPEELTFDEMMIMTVEFLGAGVDTTSRTALNMMYLLGRNPRVQSKLREEIAAVVGADSDLEVDQFSKLKYMKHVIKVCTCLSSIFATYIRYSFVSADRVLKQETFRMIPTIPANGRILTRDTVLGGYLLPAGTNLTFNHFVMSHDPKLVSDPDQFLPERWETKDIHAAVVMPFGSGSRKCIGSRIAEIELHAFFVHLLRRFELLAAPEEMEMVASTGLAPVGSTPLRLRLIQS